MIYISLWPQVMYTLEPYLQNKFQLSPDESEASDHSFKFANMISASIRTGKVFMASYDSLSLSGMCTFNRLVHTKSNDEIRPLLQQYRDVRINSGATVLKRVEGDGGGDRSLWPEIFQELKSNVKPWRPTMQNGQPRACLAQDKYVVFTTSTEAENWALGMAEKVASLAGETVYGLDTECNLDETRSITRVIGICLPPHIYDKVVVLDLTEMGILTAADFPVSLKRIMENPKLIPTAVNVTFDIPRLDALGVKLSRGIEIMELGKQLEPNHQQGYGMQKLCSRLLSLYVDKFGQNSDWRTMKDCADLKEYAALDPYLHLQLYSTLKLLISDARSTGQLPITSLTQGRNVQLTYRNHVCATGELEFVGGTDGEIQKWGQLTIGRNKSLVRVKQVIMSSVRPAFSYQLTAEEISAGIQGWNHTIAFLKEVFEQRQTLDGLLVAWPTNRVRVQLESIEEELLSSDTSANMDGDVEINSNSSDGSVDELMDSDSDSCANSDSIESIGHIGNGNVAYENESDDSESGSDSDAGDDDENNTTDMPQMPQGGSCADGDGNDSVDSNNSDGSVGSDAGDDDENDSIDMPRTRQKMDRFHAFDSMPSSSNRKTKNVLKMIRRLVIQATIEFDVDDWEAMTIFLADHHAITDLEDILDHFYYNREYWYRRVRNYPPPASKGGDSIVYVRDFILAHPVLKVAWNRALEDYFENLEVMSRKGQLEESHDVEMYQWDGTDKYGLNLWLRRRGSNRSENMHQKMRVAFGPHGVGVEVGHFLLLLVTYRYNINSGVRRKGFHNFGMPYHDIIDRIQIRYLQLFGSDPFPEHGAVNQALFDPIKDFVAVGVGPLNYDSKFVDHGEPHPKLTGGLLFLARKMKLKGPPLHVAHPREMHLFNEFMREHPRPTAKTWDELAALFKFKSDYETIFPKLPSMLRNYYNKWKVTQELTMLKDAVRTDYYGLLIKLGKPSRNMDNAAAEFQKNRSDAQMEEPVVNLGETVAEAAIADLPLNPMPVPPIVAPAQISYVVSGDGRGRHNRLCGAAAFGCPRLAKNCSGRNGGWQNCELVKRRSAHIDMPSTDFDRKCVLAAYRRDLKRTRMADDRNSKKKKRD